MDIINDTNTSVFDSSRYEVTAYSLSDLQNYFGTISPNEAIMYGLITDYSFLQFERINSVFPILYVKETQVHSLYSTFTVSEGGLFFVFWSTETAYSFSDRDDRGKESLRAIITVYINNLCDYRVIEDKQKELHTANDVYSFCEATELCFTSSSGVVSFSLLSDHKLLVVDYCCSNVIRTRNDLVIKSSRIVDINSCSYSSYLATINWAEIDNPNQ